MQYKVRALSTDQRMTQITLDAQDEADVHRQLAARGLFPAVIRPARPSLLASLPSARTGDHLSLVLFSQELLALLNAGLSIVEGLEALLEKEAHHTARAILARLLDALREGRRFSAALAQQPDLFPALYVGIVKAAEGTSDLPRALARYIDYRQRIDGIRARIVSAAIYPLILMLVGGCVSVFLIGYVVPRFAEVYQGAGRSLPWLSQLLLDWGRFAASHAPALLAALATGSVALAVVLHRFFAHGGAARILTRLPGIGERARIVELSRLYLTMGMLLEGGIPVVAAMATLEDMLTPAARTGMRAARLSIESGTPLSDAFETNRLTTPVSLRMLRVGERSGELGRMLTQSAAFYDGEIGRWIERFARTFEPLLMATIGLVVGTIVVLLYMPIFDLAGSLS